MVMTLMSRKRWVIPLGTTSANDKVSLVFYAVQSAVTRGKRTASVVIEVQELVAPLGDDPKSIFKESDDDEETSDHRKVAGSGQSFSSMKNVHGFREPRAPWPLVVLREAAAQGLGGELSRLDWLADRIQHILNLAGVLANCVQRARFAAVLAGSSKGGRGTDSHAVRGTSLLSHGRRRYE